jgi:2-oxoglutarate ferredoxin oxidoreductase subunit beta
MRYEDGFPEPIGVFRCVERPRYDAMVNEQIDQATNKQGVGDLGKLFRSGETWEVA